MVVDFGQLAPDPLIRCAADFERGSGLDALAEAGVQTEGVASSAGDAFICRIDGEPSASTDLSASGEPGYREDCLDIPPTTAHWSYWYVEAGRWIESDLGARSRQVTKGGTEGWSYTLGEGPNRPPAVAPDGVGHTSPEPADSSDCEASSQEEPGAEESDSAEGTGGLGSQEPPGGGASGQEEPAAEESDSPGEPKVSVRRSLPVLVRPVLRRSLLPVVRRPTAKPASARPCPARPVIRAGARRRPTRSPSGPAHPQAPCSGWQRCSWLRWSGRVRSPGVDCTTDPGGHPGRSGEREGSACTVPPTPPPRSPLVASGPVCPCQPVGSGPASLVGRWNRYWLRRG